MKGADFCLVVVVRGLSVTSQSERTGALSAGQALAGRPLPSAGSLGVARAASLPEESSRGGCWQR